MSCHHPYTSLLNFGDLEPIGMIIQLANRIIVQPLGILEDVLVQVNELIFPADLIHLDSGVTIFDDCTNEDRRACRDPINGIQWQPEVESKFGQLILHSTNKLSPPHSPPTELKPLLDHLKYVYLDDHQHFPVIIANNLLQEQEEKLLNILRKHKKAIGWMLSNHPEINLSIYMHKILLEEEARLIRQQQRQLNPTILDVVKKEVTKLLVVEIIYPISDNQWVSLVQVVPKKSGMIVLKNWHEELRVCIDYRKLNQATHKDHFPLHFIDQVLERLAGKSHYCFLDGFSGYMQIHITQVDQHKTTFTFHLVHSLTLGCCLACATLRVRF
ncbi:hypothetical protein CR513_41219, partial [Mucuna pruriens]